MRTAAFLAASLALLASCAAEAPDGTCASDADCGAGRRCVAGACAVPGDDGGGGGGGPAEDACGGSDDCLDGPPGNVPTVYWDGEPGITEVCTVPRRTCPGDATCVVPTECRPVDAGASRSGGMRCARDEQCHSGRCLPWDGGGICLWACDGDGDCPTLLEGGVELGLVCGELVDGNVPHRTCLPGAEPSATWCRRDADCGPDDETPAPDGTTCRFRGQVARLARAAPVCQPPPASPDRTFDVCRDPASCEGGACVIPCDPNAGGAEHFCLRDPLRCTRPCDADADCPARTSCAIGQDHQRVGSWQLEFQEITERGRVLRFCSLPLNGCLDDVHCCPVEGETGCVAGWSAARKRCAVELVGAPGRERLMTTCLDPDGLAEPGACCAAHEDCDTGVCVPARPGTPCEGGGVCSSPCDPDPDPDGVPGSGDERDRCASVPSQGDYHGRSTCLPFTYVRGALEVELHACQ